jgi:hypothetical protein
LRSAGGAAVGPTEGRKKDMDPHWEKTGEWMCAHRPAWDRLHRRQSKEVGAWRQIAYPRRTRPSGAACAGQGAA